MAEATGSPQGGDDEGSTPLGSWPTQASMPPFAGPGRAAADAPTEPAHERTLEVPFERTLEGPPEPLAPAFHDLAGPPVPGGAFEAPGPAGAPAYPPPPYGYGYGGTPYGPYAYGGWAPPKNNGLAIAAMVCGICGFAICQLIAIPALILGIRARRQIRESNGAETGDAFALAGIILGGIGLALLVAIVVIYGVIIAAAVASGA